MAPSLQQILTTIQHNDYASRMPLINRAATLPPLIVLLSQLWCSPPSHTIIVSDTAICFLALTVLVIPVLTLASEVCLALQFDTHTRFIGCVFIDWIHLGRRSYYVSRWPYFITLQQSSNWTWITALFFLVRIPSRFPESLVLRSDMDFRFVILVCVVWCMSTISLILELIIDSFARILALSRFEIKRYSWANTAWS